MAAYVLASEAATLRYIRKHSSIPVPEVYAHREVIEWVEQDIFDNDKYSSTPFNPVGMPFMITSKPKGSTINGASWYPCTVCEELAPNRDMSLLYTPLEKDKIMGQLGRITYQLSRLQFDTIASVFEEEGVYQIGRCLLPALNWYGRHVFTDKEIDLGPFSSERDYYKSLISSFKGHVKSFQMGHHMFSAPFPLPDEYDGSEDLRVAIDRWNDFARVGDKVNSGKNRLQYVIVGELLLEMVPSLAHEVDPQNGLDARYPLHHPNLSAENISVDDDCNITRITGWAFSSTVPLSTLLVTPGLP